MPRGMSNEPVYRGLLDLARLGEAVKNAKEEGELFKDHNKHMDSLEFRIGQLIRALKDVYSEISGESRSTVEARMAIEAPRKPYNQRSTLSLYLEWVQIGKLILDDLNEFYDEDSANELADAISDARNELDSLTRVMEKPYKR